MLRPRLLVTPTIAPLLALLALASGSSAAGPGQVAPLPPIATADGRAGVCYSYYPGPSGRPYLPLVRDAGSRWDRFDFIWPNIEPTSNSWFFDAYDDLVDDMSDLHMNVVGILLWTPDWAATPRQRARPQSRRVRAPSDWYAPSLMAPQAPSTLSPSPPQGLFEEWDDWTTTDGDPINYWGRYVHTVVSRYSDPARFGTPVKHWEVWNEVDDGAWDYFWTGSESEYAQLLKVGYLATKAACSDCTVLYGGLLFWADQQYYERVLDILNDELDAQASNYYFDVMSVHLYSRSSTVYDIVEHVRSRVRTHVGDHPIWLTETGVPVWDDASVDPDPSKYDHAATEEEAAHYIIQSYANGRASGIERYLFFRANDEDMVEYFGLMRNDRSFRPSYVAYQVASGYLVTPTMVTNWTYGDGTRRVTLWGTPRGKVSVVWNTEPTSHVFEYPAILDRAWKVDGEGAAQLITATGAHYSLHLPGATASLVTNSEDYFIGGAPYLIIEEDTSRPSRVHVDPLPSITPSTTIPITCEASDTGAGIWGFELNVREAEGTWAKWGHIHSSPIAFTDGRAGVRTCFRVRAWDRAGNVGSWGDAERCTTVRPSYLFNNYLPVIVGES